MALAPNRSRAKRTLFSTFADQLYPEDDQQEPVTVAPDEAAGSEPDGTAGENPAQPMSQKDMADKVYPDGTEGEVETGDDAENQADSAQEDEGHAGTNSVHSARLRLVQALEDVIQWNGKIQPYTEQPANFREEAAAAGGQLQEPGNGDAAGNTSGFNRNLLRVLLRLGGLNTQPKPGSQEEVQLANIYDGLDQELALAKQANSVPLSPEEEQNRTMGYAASMVKRYGPKMEGGEHGVAADAVQVRVPTQEEWDSIVDVGGPIPRLVRNNKLLYGNDDKKYEALTGIKNGISELQRKLGIEVTGKFDKRTHFAARKAFVAMILPWAEKAEKDWGVPVQLTVGQALLESSSGLETPSDIDNKERSSNLYGIKAKNGDYYVTDQTLEQDPITKKYDRVRADFKSYDDYEQSVIDHARFLHNGTPTFRQKYPAYDAMTRSGDLRLWAKGLSKAGYATESDYENRLLNSMKLSDRIIRELKVKGK